MFQFAEELFWNNGLPYLVPISDGLLSIDVDFRRSALGTWVFSVIGALIAIPVGIKRKSLAPLVFFGTTGTMLDIIVGISQCEREHAEHQLKLQEEAAQNASPETQDSQS